MPPWYSPRNLAPPTTTSMITSLTRSSTPQTPQRYTYSSGGGPKGMSMPSLGNGLGLDRPLSSLPDLFEFVIDHSIFGVPDLPHPHLVLTVLTDQRIATQTLLITLTVGQGRDDFDRPLDDAFDLGQSLLNQVFNLFERLRSLHPVIADSFAAFGKNVLNHPTNKGIDIDPFPLHPIRL